MCLVSLFDYCPDGKMRSAIRATEGLAESRIPPRKAIRENCPLEFPHIMLLIDDRGKTVIEPLKDKNNEVVYEGELNSGGGKVVGYNITATDGVTAALNALCRTSAEKYGKPLLFLVGDGNHSLATAKACAVESNPLSQYALVEIVNIYDEGLKFQPIHRVIFTASTITFLYRNYEKNYRLKTEKPLFMSVHIPRKQLFPKIRSTELKQFRNLLTNT